MNNPKTEQEQEVERELRIDLALLQAAAIINAGTGTDLKPDEVPALAARVRQLWEEIHQESESE